ncbi:acylphosphatase-2-like isoform X2 [Megalops cyprinoides]|uniref:acylphosphatase-2-like isoform X2 n=1 Tax=Megalops cyprinoides TaxID=118141 RepID=UPI001863C05C|nr:acylphosphatase-2-like isoform X2 [Megalops cyprinoides]
MPSCERWSGFLVLNAFIFLAMSNNAVDGGVCFRMYTEDQGKKLGVNGWVKNTRQGTVVGQVQGPADKVREMKAWLSKVGSPSSRIDRAVFSNERDIPKLEIRGFGTRY